MILISGPVIARLDLRTRKSAHEHIRWGHYGPVHEIRGVLYVELSSVEARMGCKLPIEQLELAAEGRPGSLLTLPEAEPMEAPRGPYSVEEEARQPA